MDQEQLSTDELAVILSGNNEYSLAEIEERSHVSDDPMVVYLSGLSSERSRLSMLSNLHRAARFLLQNLEATAEHTPWSLLRFKHVRALHSMMVEAKLAPATIKVTIAAVRGVMRTAYDLEQITADDLLRITNIRYPKGRGTRGLSGRCLDDDEIDALFHACKDGTPSGVRDQAILSVLFGTGFRREEVAIISLSDYDKENKLLTVITKGNKERKAHLPQGTLLSIEAWLNVRSRELGPLFCPIHRSGKLQLNDKLSESRIEGQMSPQAIYNILEKRYLLAGIRKCSPHDGRRTFTTKMIDQTKDISLVQKILDHSSIETTSKYDRREEEAKKRAVDSFYVPHF